MSSQTKRSLFSFVAIIVLLMVAIAPPAFAAPNTNRGYMLNGTDYDGLHTIVSTMVGTGSPPAFAFSLKSPDVFQMFASSAIHPKGSCISANVWHRRYVGGSTTAHEFVMSNFCSGGVQSGTWTWDMTNITVRSKYVRTNTYNDTGTSFQDEVIELRVIKTDTPSNQWTVYLYNFNTSAYDFIAQKSGTILETQGWAWIGDGGYTQDPTMSCPTLYPWGIMQMRAIQKRVSGSWSNIGSGDITSNITDSWPCLSTNNYQERRTIAYQFKIEPYGVAYGPVH